MDERGLNNCDVPCPATEPTTLLLQAPPHPTFPTPPPPFPAPHLTTQNFTSLTCCCSHPTYKRTSLKSLLPSTTGEATPWLPGNHNAHHRRDLFSLHLGAVASAKANDLDTNLPLSVKHRAFLHHNEDGNQKLKTHSALNRLCQNIPFMFHSSEEGP